MFKLAVLDIDGTLVDDKGQLSKKTIETVQTVKKSGAFVTICTGRNITKALPIVKKLKIEIPFVCIDGTLMYDPVKNKIIKDLKLSQEETHFILDTAKDKHAFVELSDGNKYYKYIKNKELLQYDIFNKHTIWGHMKSYFGGIRYISNFERLKGLKEPYYQIVIASEIDIIEEIKKEIQKGGFERIEIRDYLWEKFLFINRKGIKKSQGVQMLCNYFDVSIDEVVTIGDEENDVDMIQLAGMGVAMGNAVENVKAVADFVTANNNENGAALALEKYFL